MAAFAEHEAEMISRRTKEALAAAKARGVKLGNPRLRAGDRFCARAATRARIAAADAYAADVGPYIDAAKKRGCRSLRQLADALTAGAIETPGGRRQWSRAQVSRVIRRNCNAAAISFAPCSWVRRSPGAPRARPHAKAVRGKTRDLGLSALPLGDRPPQSQYPVADARCGGARRACRLAIARRLRPTETTLGSALHGAAARSGARGRAELGALPAARRLRDGAARCRLFAPGWYCEDRDLIALPELLLDADCEPGGDDEPDADDEPSGDYDT